MESNWCQVVDAVIEKLRAMVSGLFEQPCTGEPACADDEAGVRQAMSEHQLITYCAERGAFTGIEHLSANLALFYKHFLMMHVLYSLQGQWRQQGLYLRVSPLAIECVRLSDASGGTQLGQAEAALADYYCDLAHLRDITDDQVADLLSNFWSMLAADQDEVQARGVLDLDASADWSSIQKAYRRKAAATHPDKGGSEQEFIQVQQAFDVLATKYARRGS